MLKKCIVCDREFNAKRDTAKFCGPVCRVRYSRQIDDDVVVAPTVIDTIVPKGLGKRIFMGALDRGYKCPKCGFDMYFPENEWSHSACHKTQEEIETHYTLNNYPFKARYHSSGGGGSGSLSPYNMSDPRHKAYTLN